MSRAAAATTATTAATTATNFSSYDGSTVYTVAIAPHNALSISPLASQTKTWQRDQEDDLVHTHTHPLVYFGHCEGRWWRSRHTHVRKKKKNILSIRKTCSSPEAISHFSHVTCNGKQSQIQQQILGKTTEEFAVQPHRRRFRYVQAGN